MSKNNELQEEIVKIFEEAVADGYDDLYNSGMYQGLDEGYFLKKGFFIKEMQHKGGEGQGETYFTVYSFIKGNQIAFVKFYGYYYSYDGANYEGYEFVTPYVNVSVEYK